MTNSNITLELLEKYEEKDYNYLLDNYKLITEYENIDHSLVNIYEYLIKTYFYLERFDEVINFFNLLEIKRIESIDILTYGIASYLSKGDLYSVIRIINKSEMINISYKMYLDDEDASFHKILKANDCEQVLLVLGLFVKKLSKSFFNEATSEEIKIELFEVLGLLTEFGYSKEVINNLMQIGILL